MRGEYRHCAKSGLVGDCLWRNALRYCSKQPGSVRLCARSSERRAMLEIIDDGPGIGEETAHQLFEPFFTTAEGGSGLGLYIARELCEANGALLEYVPVASGGACFRIIFGEWPDER